MNLKFQEISKEMHSKLSNTEEIKNVRDNMTKDSKYSTIKNTTIV